MIKLNISFGVLSPTIADQLEEQSFKYDASKLETIQKMVQATNLLRIQGILTSAQSDSCYKKLLRKIQEALT